jgi:hypothetical protein
MSYYEMPNGGLYPGYYQNLLAGTPGWQEAPVPGWGINPLRAGPTRVGVGAFPLYSDNVPEMSDVLPRYAPIGAVAADASACSGYIAGSGAAGIVLGLTFGWLWFKRKS